MGDVVMIYQKEYDSVDGELISRCFVAFMHAQQYYDTPLFIATKKRRVEHYDGEATAHHWK